MVSIPKKVKRPILGVVANASQKGIRPKNSIFILRLVQKDQHAFGMLGAFQAYRVFTQFHWVEWSSKVMVIIMAVNDFANLGTQGAKPPY